MFDISYDISEQSRLKKDKKKVKHKGNSTMYFKNVS